MPKAIFPVTKCTTFKPQKIANTYDTYDFIGLYFFKSPSNEKKKFSRDRTACIIIG